MCKRVNKQAFAAIIAVLALLAASPAAFAGGVALTGTRMPAPVIPVPEGVFHSIPLGGTIPAQAQGAQALGGTITGITGQALNGTAPKTVNIPIPGTSKSIPLSGSVVGSRATGVLIGVNLFTVKLP